MASQLSSPRTDQSDGASSHIPIVSFDANQPDITALAQERLGLPSDGQTFSQGVLKAVGLSGWDRFTTFRKVWAVAWRIVLFAAIAFVGIKFLGPLAALLLIGMLVTFVMIGAVLKYKHNHHETLDAAAKDLAAKTSKVYWTSQAPPDKANQWTQNIRDYKASMDVFQNRLWNRLEMRCLAPIIRAGVPFKQEREFAIKLAHIDMESIVMGALQELEKSLAGNRQVLPATKMRMAYDLCEELWARYQKQMEHYPWLENPETNAQITEEQAMDASAQMLQQRIGINLVLIKYWNCVYLHQDALVPPRFDQDALPKDRSAELFPAMTQSELAHLILDDGLGLSRPLAPVDNVRTIMRAISSQGSKESVATFFEGLGENNIYGQLPACIRSGGLSKVQAPPPGASVEAENIQNLPNIVSLGSF